MPYYPGLPAALARRGLTVELVPGWETRGSSAFNPIGSVSHWTAGNTTSDRGSLAICVNGKTGVPGPLCNTFLPRNNVVIVVAAGRANHAGAGGIGGLVGNSSVWGTEAENSGGGEWTPFQRWAYPRVNAAYVDLGARREHIYGHSEWTPRKIDIRDWPMSLMRQQVLGLLAPLEGFLMALNEDQQAELYNLVKNGRAADNKWQQTIEDLLRGTYNKAAIGTDITAQNRATLAGQDAALGTIETDVSVSRTMLSEQAETISAAITAAIREATGGSVEHAVIDQAVRDAVASLTIVLPEPDEATP